MYNTTSWLCTTPRAAGPRCCMIAANSTMLGVDPTGHVS
jgi:hypothetical protein